MTIRPSVTFIALFLAFTGCGILKPKGEGELSDVATARAIAAKPIPPEKAEELLRTTGDNYLFGNGLGETALTVGTVLIFPPYGLYVLGNTVLDLAGYQPLHITNMLPPEGKEAWDTTYDDITSGPGRLAAASAGEEFRTRTRVKSETGKFIDALKSEQSTDGNVDYDKADRTSSKD